MEQGVKYEFIVPSDLVEDFRRFVISEFNLVANDANRRPEPTIGCIEQHQFKSLAVTHYRVLNSEGRRKVLLEVPIEPSGYWVDTEGEAVDGFFSRFAKMKATATCKLVSISPQLPGPD